MIHKLTCILYVDSTHATRLVSLGAERTICSILRRSWSKKAAWWPTVVRAGADAVCSAVRTPLVPTGVDSSPIPPSAGSISWIPCEESRGDAHAATHAAQAMLPASSSSSSLLAAWMAAAAAQSSGPTGASPRNPARRRLGKAGGRELWQAGWE
eukprot:CAMPEP_0181211210 /NCGR_PEP_ID=MMETSP1096-20121128/23659_1 /TAXON_ID=156174 ORGANISM="Chrysochromulina ericina, Strain CCMP281" /NCGR_SAMPLE_ID=MMETSP1096 /ASSEMBLY_ACC=CAM_ASM_000453 /LENGTH=153 /DNA_ID=CAMNT_0023302585 /DNA_START=28 /DNA_END=491 /DNA_ORIENTATION=+